ncbi:glycoside hydrolase family 88 protein [Massilia pinisoli]|uniref:Glycoside hydrolase family 88 protein n=1 Tax=Massilia pinisoli TaxID=1772194 RepID=A0ABT1ZVN9_9BURK|nr:glycoside hydrolase family 88 protein [Massilia pinisoli]MCS0584021.1 glycoside hydrolase family 88 protein [Massilia pinisoli]
MNKRVMAGVLAGGLLLLGGCADLGSHASVPAQEQAATVPSRAEALAVIDKVNGHWQRTTPATEWAFWNVAVYHTGNIAAYEVTGNEAYRQYSERWAEYNGWRGAKSDNKTEWKLTYGETDDHVLFGDWQVCFQTYLDLYRLGPQDPRRVARAREVMGYEIGTERVDYWWWADGLYMVMPVMTKMYRLTGDRRYLDKMVDYFQYSNGLMYDADAHLYYRDARYVYPQHKSVNGKKDFWARGDGWVFAALAKVLADLPRDDPYRALFEDRFREMAQTLRSIQAPDGYWTRSLIDPAHSPGPETSGTAFFTYGMLWGINNGVLDRTDYLPTALKGWHYLTHVAIQPDGKVGYVQPIGDRAVPGQVVDRDSTAHFGVGAVLLAAAEMARLGAAGH